MHVVYLVLAVVALCAGGWEWYRTRNLRGTGFSVLLAALFFYLAMSLHPELISPDVAIPILASLAVAVAAALLLTINPLGSKWMHRYRKEQRNEEEGLGDL